MSRIYKKHNPSGLRRIIRYSGLAISSIGLLCLIYISYPLVFWKLYFEPENVSASIQSPIPKTAILSGSNMKTLLASALDSINLNYSDARNWFPEYKNTRQKLESNPAIITTFNISIPRLGIKYANVSTVDTDLSKHLVLYPGTPLPPGKGNAVIIGHSTIPSWFNPADYKTIFATVHTLKKGDLIYTTVNAKEYLYRIISIIVTTPQDTSVFAQDPNDNYLTMITCTPPGTTWKRLIIKAKKL